MKLILTFLLIMAFVTDTYAQNISYNNTNGIAIKGYDPVAYFLQKSAIAGNNSYRYDWSGSSWKFSSLSNLDSFKIAPQKYAPQYGGFCAYGCSENHKSPTDPNAWTIIDDKLYLNYNLKVKELWLTNTAVRIKTADKYWPALNQ